MKLDPEKLRNLTNGILALGTKHKATSFEMAQAFALAIGHISHQAGHQCQIENQDDFECELMGVPEDESIH